MEVCAEVSCRIELLSHTGKEALSMKPECSGSIREHHQQEVRARHRFMQANGPLSAAAQVWLRMHTLYGRKMHKAYKNNLCTISHSHNRLLSTGSHARHGPRSRSTPRKARIRRPSPILYRQYHRYGCPSEQPNGQEPVEEGCPG